MPRWEGQLNKIDDYRWEIPQTYKPGMRVPGLVYADEAMLKAIKEEQSLEQVANVCLLYTSPSPRDRTRSRMPSSA